jgi:predicted MFS family arabinose efflux permease
MQTTQAVPVFTSYQKFIIAVLAFLQFTIILDFMIMAPLGALMMPALKMTTAQFGVVVSAYAFSAGASGLLAAGFADKFDRKKLLLFFYCGFVLGTFLCAIANSYEFMLGARIVTGIFGGVIGSIVLAITTDLFSFEQRGRVMGFVQSAFAASQILGLPAGLYFSNLWGWHAPFLMIVGISLAVGFFIWFFVKPVDEHLKYRSENTALKHFYLTINNSKYILAFAATAFLSVGGFMIMPFGSDFTVRNVGIPIEKLPVIYLVSGISSMFIGPIVGRISDKFGKFKTFLAGTLLSSMMVVIYTNLGVSTLITVILVNVIMFMGIFSRMIPSQALMSAIPTPDKRGSFMSINSSLQYIAGGAAAVIAGLVVSRGEAGQLEHFDTLGYIIVGTSMVTLVMMYFIHQLVPEKK